MADPAPHAGTADDGRRPPTFALYRIIGNDLPPRHVPGQHLRNLAFVLEEEPELERCQKWWVLNRLTDAGEERELTELLDERGVDHLRLPFRLEEYARYGWRLDFERPLFDADFHALGPKQRALLLEHTYHDKNRYVMNNNGARNTALDHGRQHADWVLPWDGNCFLTAPAWAELVAAVDADPQLSYVVVPMARAGDDEIRHRDEHWRPAATDEPQIAFATGAPERFDEDLRYGRNPKAALLRALGVPGVWNERAHEPWEPGLPEPGSARGRWTQASWVVRLSSGRADLEQRAGARVRQRREAIATKLDDLDERVARRRFDAARLLTWDEGLLRDQRSRWAGGHPPLRRVVSDLAADGRALVGVDEPGAPLAAEVVVCALAWWFTGDRDVAVAGAERLRRLLVAPATRLTPALDALAGHAAELTGHADLAEPRELIDLAEALRLLERSNALPSDEAASARAWFGELAVDLVVQRERSPAAQRGDHAGLWYEALTMAAAAVADDAGELCRTHRRVCSRLQQHVDGAGVPVADLASPESWDDSASAMLAWLVLARMTDGMGRDLWCELSIACDDGGAPRGRLPAALVWFLAASANGWPGRQRAPHDLDLDEVVALRAAAAGCQPPGPVGHDPDAAYRIKQRFPVGVGLHPYWPLGA